jgi:isocitrate dehydrogenase (NAD+)
MTDVVVSTGSAPQTFELVAAALAAAGAGVAWERVDGSLADTAAAIRRAGVGFVVPAGGAAAVELRRTLGIFAQHRPVRSAAGFGGRHGPIDVLLVRETTEDVYAHLEHESVPGVFESLKVTTRAATERVARHTFETARALGRKKVTIVHKSNIMKLSDGMFLRVCQEIGQEYAGIEVDEVIVDALCMKLVLHPGRFDVLLSGNLYGDILSDLLAGLVGGVSNAPAINHGPGVRVFTAAHGDAPERDGTDAADPFPVLVPALALLEHVGQGAVAAKVRAKVEAALLGGLRPAGAGGDTPLPVFLAALR